MPTMAMGRQGPQQGEMLVRWDELPKSPGHVFYDRLQAVLIEAGFDAFVETLCKRYYAAILGAPSLPPGRYLRVHLRRCRATGSSTSPRSLPWSTRPRRRARPSPARARRGVPTPRRTPVREPRGAGGLARMAKASGIETPTTADLKPFDRERKGKRLSNVDWASPSDLEARITRMQDGRTRLAYKPEHAVDLDTEAIVTAKIHPADRGDTTTPDDTLEAAARGLDAADRAPGGGRWQTRIAEPKPKEVQRWRGDLAASSMSWVTTSAW